MRLSEFKKYQVGLGTGRPQPPIKFPHRRLMLFAVWSDNNRHEV